MENWFGLYLALLSATCFCKSVSSCFVPETQKSSVTNLAINLGRKVGPCVPPDPSVLLALNLGQVKDPTAREILIEQLKKDAVDRVSNNESFTSGKVALYVLALRSSCVDPSNISVSGRTINLVQILEDKTREELKDFEDNQPNPAVLTTWYQVGLDIISLCVKDRPCAISAAHILANHISIGTHGSVDTAAVVAMGLTCVLGMENVPEETSTPVNKTLHEVLNYMSEQQNDGNIGNDYSTGLAAQAFIAAKALYPLDSWDCSATVQKLITLISQDTFSLPITAAQVLPFLWGTHYVSVKDLQCPHDDVDLISVGFNIVNDITGEHFNHFTIVEVKKGSTLLQVMQKAAEQDSTKFSFKSQDSSFGAFITSINNLEGNTNDKTYWQFFSGNSPLTQGVSSYKPRNNENINVIFSRY